MDFGIGMRTMRGMRNIGQVRLAFMVGLSMASISRAESGKQKLNDQTQSRIRIALTWSPELDPLLEKIQLFQFEQ